MTPAEKRMLAIFRRFQIGPNQMLCLNNFVNDGFSEAIERLVESKLVVKDRPKHGYYQAREQ